ncbi:MAG TPA: transcriptional regulator [Flavobacteriaceae bacterium]|nr:transcriptional regulator [Flavobacteriaceae bacterium]
MKKVLLIEDNQDIRETTADILTLADFEVETAANGKLGVALAKTFQPDIIVCDIMMPELDGYGVLHILSKNPQTAHIPFIFLTAKSDKGDLRKGMNLGADDYLTKPFEETDLLDAISMRLKKNEMLRQEFSKDVKGINQFFDEVSKYDDVKELSKDRRLELYTKKSELFREGRFAKQLYFIESGKVKTYKTTEDGKEFVTGFYGPGDFIGFIPLFTEASKYTDTAVILEDAEICKIPKEDFTTLIFGSKNISNTFITMLSNNLKERETQLAAMAFATVRQRTAKLLVYLNDKNDNQENTIPAVTISREDLAGSIGAAKETAIRSLSQLKDDDLIRIEGKEILLLDVEQLVKISQSGYL